MGRSRMVRSRVRAAGLFRSPLYADIFDELSTIADHRAGEGGPATPPTRARNGPR